MKPPKPLNNLLRIIPLRSYYPSWLQLLVVVVFGGVVATVFLLLGFHPRTLQARKQIIRIEFRNEPPFVDKSLRRIDEGARRWETYFYRVRIVNTSDEKTVRVRYLKLTDLRELHGTEFKPWRNTADLPLQWDQQNPLEIPPGGSVLAQFARIFPPDLEAILDANLTGPNDIPQFVFTVAPGGWPIQMVSKVPPGTHRFRVTAYFDNAPPAQIRLEMECPPEKGRNTPAAMVSALKIRMR